MCRIFRLPIRYWKNVNVDLACFQGNSARANFLTGVTPPPYPFLSQMYDVIMYDGSKYYDGDGNGRTTLQVRIRVVAGEMIMSIEHRASDK